MDIVIDAGRLIQFHGKLRKTNPIYESWGIFSARKQRFQPILSMMAENLSNFTANSEKLTQFTNLETYFQHQSREFKQYWQQWRWTSSGIFTPMTETLHNIYSDGRMLNPKYMEIEVKFTTTAEDLNDISNGCRTLYVHF
jgi:hypothetical protein